METNLKQLRKQKGVLQKDVAKALNIARTTYVQWENGQNEPNLQALLQLSNYFETTIEDILGLKKEHTNINEKRLLNAFRKMNPANQNSLVTFAEYSVSQQQKNTQNK